MKYLFLFLFFACSCGKPDHTYEVTKVALRDKFGWDGSINVEVMSDVVIFEHSKGGVCMKLIDSDILITVLENSDNRSINFDSDKLGITAKSDLDGYYQGVMVHDYLANAVYSDKAGKGEFTTIRFED